jgi:hypothetical protein
VIGSRFKVQGLLIKLAGRDRRSGSKVVGKPTTYHKV